MTKEELEFHLTLHMATMGVSRVLMFPEVIEYRLPEAVHASGPRDPMFEQADTAMNTLHIYTVLLKFWLRQDFGAALDRLLARGLIFSISRSEARTPLSIAPQNPISRIGAAKPLFTTCDAFASTCGSSPAR